MIKRNFLAVLMPLFLSSSAVNAMEIYNKNGNKVNIYGELNPLYFYSHSNDPFLLNSLGNYTQFKFGLYSRSDINQFLSGYFSFEYKPKFCSYNEKNYVNSNKNDIDLSFVGLDLGKWGTIDYGRNYGVMYYAKQFTNPAFDNSENITLHEDDNFLIGRADGLLTYHNKNLSGYIKGLDLTLQHQIYYKNENMFLSDKYNDSWGTSLRYNTDFGFTLVGSAFFSPYDNTRNNVNLENHWVKSYGIGWNYSFKNATVSGFYGHSKNSASNFIKSHCIYNVLDNIEISGSYDFNNGVKSSIGYIKSFGKEYSFGQNISNAKSATLNNHINLIVTYNFNENFIANFHYKLNLLKSCNTNFNLEYSHYLDNCVGAGFSYIF
ncbi:porin [Buchnera aphidicola]|uniref:porin n=1 Tax=Buchnera aphidicola TaxID=9 RepID=UPI002237B951|nr:porin [Buchnera aphidicola]MCW5197783.1 porin [Buchnera aphidicola (Chaitophorus viminalis)]